MSGLLDGLESLGEMGDLGAEFADLNQLVAEASSIINPEAQEGRGGSHYRLWLDELDVKTRFLMRSVLASGVRPTRPKLVT